MMALCSLSAANGQDSQGEHFNPRIFLQNTNANIFRLAGFWYDAVIDPDPVPKSTFSPIVGTASRLSEELGLDHQMNFSPPLDALSPADISDGVLALDT